MSNFEAIYASWVVRNRLLIIVLCLATVAALANGAGRLRFDTSYRAFFSDDNPQLIAFAAYSGEPQWIRDMLDR